MPPIQGTPKEYDSEKASTFPLDQEYKKPLLRPWFYNLGFILFFFSRSPKFKAEIRSFSDQNETFSQWNRS